MTRTVRLQLLAFVLVTVVGVTYLIVTYTPIPRVFGAGYTVVAEFSDYGGIYGGAAVTYRGHQIGEVGQLRLTDTGVAVVLELDGDEQVPADTRAEIRQLSVVGEQFVDLQPRRSGPPYLSDGARIPDSRTAPGSPPADELLANVQALVTSVGKQNLRTVVDELNTAFQGTGPNLQRLLDSTTALVGEAQANLPQTRRLLRDGRTVLNTQVDVGSSIRSFSSDLAKLTRQFRQSDPDIRATLRRGIPLSRQTVGLLRDLEPNLRVLLTNLVSVGQVTVPRLAGAEQGLALLPVDIAAAMTALPGDGTAHFGLVANLNAPPPCTEGYGSSPRRYPQNTTPRPGGPITAFCQEDEDPDIAVRGSRYAGLPSEEPTPRFPDNPANNEQEGPLELYLPGSGN